MLLSDLIPNCSMERFVFIDHGQKYDALKYLDDNNIDAIYMDTETWVAVNKNHEKYELAEKRINMIRTGEI